MAYSPTTWTTGDTISASALNKIEQGIAGAGASLIVNVTDTGDGIVMDKTYVEIYEAMKDGRQCLVRNNLSAYYSNIDDDYHHEVALGEITLCYKYDTVYRVIATCPRIAMVSNQSNQAVPGVYVFAAETSTDYPWFVSRVYASPSSCTYDISIV